MLGSACTLFGHGQLPYFVRVFLLLASFHLITPFNNSVCLFCTPKTPLSHSTFSFSHRDSVFCHAIQYISYLSSLECKHYRDDCWSFGSLKYTNYLDQNLIQNICIIFIYWINKWKVYQLIFRTCEFKANLLWDILWDLEELVVSQLNLCESPL